MAHMLWGGLLLVVAALLHPAVRRAAGAGPVGARRGRRGRPVHRRGGQVHHRVERLLLRAGGAHHLRRGAAARCSSGCVAQPDRPTLPERRPRRAPSRRSATSRTAAYGDRPGPRRGAPPGGRRRAGAPPTDIEAGCWPRSPGRARTGRLAAARLDRAGRRRPAAAADCCPTALERLLVRVGLFLSALAALVGLLVAIVIRAARSRPSPTRPAPSRPLPSPSGCCCSALVWVVVGVANGVALVLSLAGRHPTGMAVAQYAVLLELVAGGLLNVVRVAGRRAHRGHGPGRAAAPDPRPTAAAGDAAGGCRGLTLASACEAGRVPDDLGHERRHQLPRLVRHVAEGPRTAVGHSALGLGHAPSTVNPIARAASAWRRSKVSITSGRGRRSAAARCRASSVRTS